MGLCSPQPQKQTTTDSAFRTEPCLSPTVLGSQDGELHNVSWQQVEDGLEDVFDDSNQFLVLTLQKIKHNIRYVQTTQCDDGIVSVLTLSENFTVLPL